LSKEKGDEDRKDNVVAWMWHTDGHKGVVYASPVLILRCKVLFMMHIIDHLYIPKCMD
jgi:hypothetical protein